MLTFNLLSFVTHRLQDEYTALQKELKSTIEDSRLIQEKYTKLLDDARAELAANFTENEQLRTQVVNQCCQKYSSVTKFDFKFDNVRTSSIFGKFKIC